MQGGVAPIAPIDHGNAWSVYSADPDGNGIEIYLETAWYVAQPHAHPLDLRLSDDDLQRISEVEVRAHPTHTSRRSWQGELERKLSTSHTHTPGNRPWI